MYRERKEKILSMLEEKGHLSVKEIKDEIEVSAMTILRDLTKMEQEGLIVKGFGEISKVKGIHLERFMAVEGVDSYKEQDEIVQIAKNLVADGDTVIFGHGNIIFNLAKEVQNKKLIALTPSLRAGLILEKGQSKVYLTGGHLSNNGKSLYGEYAEQFVRNFHADKAFITCAGLNTHGDLCEYSEGEVGMKRVITEHAKNTYLLLEDDKIGINKFFRADDLSKIKVIVTNKRPSEFFMKLFKNYEITVMY